MAKLLRVYERSIFSLFSVSGTRFSVAVPLLFTKTLTILKFLPDLKLTQKKHSTIHKIQTSLENPKVHKSVRESISEVNG